MTSELTGQYKGIGKITVAFNLLDAELNQFISWLINENALGIGSIVTTEIWSVSSRFELFFTLYKYSAASFRWYKPADRENYFEIRKLLVAEANRLQKRSKSIVETRNKIIHAAWFQQQRHVEEFGKRAQLTGVRTKVDRSPAIKAGKVGLEYEVIHYSQKQLASFYKEINAFRRDLKRFRIETFKPAKNKK